MGASRRSDDQWSRDAEPDIRFRHILGHVSSGLYSRQPEHEVHQKSYKSDSCEAYLLYKKHEQVETNTTPEKKVRVEALMELTGEL